MALDDQATNRRNSLGGPLLVAVVLGLLLLMLIVGGLATRPPTPEALTPVPVTPAQPQPGTPAVPVRP